MICQRCGTEFENEDSICPRCDYGRPKAKKQLPQWAWWLIIVGAVLAIAGSVLVWYLNFYFSDDWMDGSWESKSLAISFDAEEDHFILANGETVVSGEFTANKDSFTLTTEEGTIYVYRYERVNANKMKLMFSQGNETIKVTVNRVVSEEEPEEELEEE